jgi:hypothetical protein
MLLCKILIFFVLIVFLINCQKYYDESGSISECLDGEAGILPNTCILRLDAHEEVNSTIDISANDTYIISGNSLSSHITFSLIGNFTFKISKNYTIQNINVFVVILLLLLFFTSRDYFLTK